MVRAAIVVEREEGHVYKVQQLIYYISEVLTDSKYGTRIYKNYSMTS
jgi:hypothetical protein